LKIWRIEDFKPVPVAEEFYGEFFQGDSYLILNSYKKSDGSLAHNIHFWQGTDSSQVGWHTDHAVFLEDEKGTVALKAVELDEALGGGPVQFREVQGHESDEFFGAFKALGGVTYKEGGVASGFNHVEPDVYPTVLLHIKGKRNVRTKQVAVAASSLNQGDVFILDKGLTLFLWWGSEANKQERLKGMQVLARLYNSRGARPLQIIVNEEPDNEEFWSTLGGTAADVASAEAGGADDDRAAASELKLFKVSDASGTLETTEVPMEGGKLLRSALDTNDSFIVDAGSQIYVWTGRGATAQEKKGGLAIAKAFLKEQGRPDWCPVQRVVEGGETPVFKSLFKEWAKEIDFSAIAKASSEADQVAVDDGSVELTMWILEGTTKSEYPREQYGQFFAGDSYLVQYAYTGPSGPANMIYFWLGSESDKVERGSAAVNAIELSKSIAGPSTQ
ncbi:GSN, partial [Symbiodinium sp. KB8]